MRQSHTGLWVRSAQAGKIPDPTGLGLQALPGRRQLARLKILNDCTAGCVLCYALGFLQQVLLTSLHSLGLAVALSAGWLNGEEAARLPSRSLGGGQLPGGLSPHHSYLSWFFVNSYSSCRSKLKDLLSGKTLSPPPTPPCYQMQLMAFFFAPGSVRMLLVAANGGK